MLKSFLKTLQRYDSVAWKLSVVARRFSLGNNISVRKRKTIEICVFSTVAAGTVIGALEIVKRRKESALSIENNDKKHNLSPPEVTIDKSDNEEVENDILSHAWWTGLKEISIYLNDENSRLLDDKFASVHNIIPRRKVILIVDPKAEESNEYGPIMGDVVEMKVIASISDEHSQVLLLDIGDTLSIYKYPHLVISYQSEDSSDLYSYSYGRLLIDRAEKAGLLIKEKGNVYIPTEIQSEKEVDEYYDYPKTVITVNDLRNNLITIKGQICTSRGMDSKCDICNEKKHKAECSWCVFMKDGPCFKTFTSWQRCADNHKEDDDGFLGSCSEISMALRNCVETHPEYFGVLSNESENYEDNYAENEENDEDNYAENEENDEDNYAEKEENDEDNYAEKEENYKESDAENEDNYAENEDNYAENEDNYAENEENYEENDAENEENDLKWINGRE